jgi:hypothetical protein
VQNVTGVKRVGRNKITAFPELISFNNTASTSDYRACRSKRLWHNGMYHPCNCLEGLRESMNKLSEYNQPVSRPKLMSQHTKLKAAVLKYDAHQLSDK